MKFLLCILGWIAGITLVYVSPHHRILTTVGVLLFVGCSIALIVLLAGLVWRWLSARRRGVRWALIGGALLLVGIFVFQRLRPPGDQARIERTITAVIIDKKPSYCETEVTASYLKQTTGAKAPFADDICQQEAEASRAKSVDVSEIAINGNKATAVVALRGGSFDGSRLVLRLLEEERSWKVDRLLAFRSFDRDKFERAYRRTFLEFGSPVRSADCALRRAQRFSTAEIESAALTGVVWWTFAPISVSCDRDGVERSLVKSIAEPKFGLPSRAIQCAAQKTKALSDAELVRVELSPIVYDELLYSCGRKAIFAYQRRELKAREHLNAAEVECVLTAFRNRPTPSAIRLGYDEPRYNALIAACRG
jgi:hypothetical protein